MIYILIGPIGCGKSTFTRKMAAKGALVVNDDAITKAVHGGEYTLYDPQLKPLYKQLENTIMATAVAMGRDVVIDRPCHKRSTRVRYVELAKSFDQQVTYVIFTNGGWEFQGRERFRKDNRGRTLEEWLAVAKRHEEEFEPVHPSEGYVETVAP